jgi:hypothetical protein
MLTSTKHLLTTTVIYHDEISVGDEPSTSHVIK